MIPANQFDRGKPFYPLVMHYVAQLIGFKELALRGIAGPESFGDYVTRISVLSSPPPACEKAVADIRASLQDLRGPLRLRSEYQDDYIEVDIDEMAHEVASEVSYLATTFMQSAGSLLILSHEISKDKPWHNTDPLWEFLRHCRNAAAHGGRFNLIRGEPKRPANWGKFTILPSLRGTSLFKDASRIGLLSPGDPVRLLWDIEKAYPQMCV